jgi:5-methyltetrahydrofolate--homocysteine methyltransferase
MTLFREIMEAVLEGNADQTKELVEKAITEGHDPASIINQGLVAGMAGIGSRFKNNEVYVPEVLIAARAMHTGMHVVKPLLAGTGMKDKATVIIGTVKDDLHDIGKNLVVMMLEGAGYKVVDLGIDVTPEKFAEAIDAHNAQIVGLSALLSTTMTVMRATVDYLRTYKERVKIVVGGAPVTEKFAQDIGADGYAADAASAVDVVNELLAVSAAEG